MTAILKDEPPPLAGGRRRAGRAAADRQPLPREEALGRDSSRRATWRSRWRRCSRARDRRRHRPTPRLRRPGRARRFACGGWSLRSACSSGPPPPGSSRGRRTPEARVTRFQVLAPASWRTDLNGGLIPLALSPDGRSLAGNAVNDKGDTALFVRDFDDLESRIVPGSEGAGSFFWSPDGRSLAFFVGSQLKRVDVAGGSATVICEAPTAQSRRRLDHGRRHLVWIDVGPAAGAGDGRDSGNRARPGRG